jgi:uncharacterized protein (DUF2336 family)
MLAFLKKILRSKPDIIQTVDLAKADAPTRAALAAARGTSPAILDYLSGDKDAGVRRAVAGNRATPVPVAVRLARDPDADVRLVLAARLVELLPQLTPEKHSQLYAYAVQALGAFAQDEVLNIRRALSTALKDSAFAPPEVARQLARDAEREVSEPILKFCAALDDDALLDILAGHPEPWVVSAIAARPQVSEKVSDAVIETKDAAAGTVLLNNANAALSQDTLQKIITRARECPEWHAPAALRRELSADLALQLSEFVNESVLALLDRNTSLPPAARGEIAEIVRRRAVFAAEAGSPEARLARHIRDGTLGPDAIADALALQDVAFVARALAHCSGIHPLIAEKMLKSGAARPVIALCWQAKMPMRLAVTLQRDVAKLAPRDMIYARGGTDYPLTAEEIRWQLEFFGIAAAKA